MTYRMGSGTILGGALLTGLLLVTPPVKAENKSQSPGIEKAIALDKQALGEAEENGRIKPREEQALQKLLHVLEAEEREHKRRHHQEGTFGSGFERANEPPQSGSTSTAPPGENGQAPESREQALEKLIQMLEQDIEHHHRHHHHEEGSFGAGYQQPGETSPVSTGSDAGSDPGSDSSDGSSGSNGSGGSGSGGSASSSPMGTTSGTTGKSPSASSSSQGQQAHHGRPGAFLRGLRHAEHELRVHHEERRLQRLERTFARGLIAHERAEEHKSNSSSHSTSSGTNTASSKPTANTQTSSNQGSASKPAERHDHEWHSKTHDAPRVAGFHHAQGNKGASPAAHSHTGGLVGQHPGSHGNHNNPGRKPLPAHHK
jgi:hypothetical protein